MTKIRGVTAIIVISVLTMFASCRAVRDQQTVSQSNSSQSVAEVSANMADTTEKATLQHYAGLSVMQRSQGWEIQAVPESQATVTVTEQTLRDLPEGAAFTAKSGQASVELRRTGDEITAIGHCDSLSRLCSYYAELNIRHEEMIDSLEEKLYQSKAHERQLAMELEEAQSSIQRSEVKPPDRQWLWFVLGVASSLIGFHIGRRCKT